MEGIRLIQGDCIEEMQKLIDEGVKVDTTFTSPPYYNAREYSQYASYEDYLNFIEEVFQKVKDITCDGGFVIINSSPVIEPREKRSSASKRYAIPFDINHIMQRIGFEFIDDIIWRKPEGAAKNRVGGFHQHRKPLMYKPNCVTEYIMVYRKRSNRLIDYNIRKHSKEVQEDSKIKGEYDRTNVWDLCPTFSKHHPAIFPTSLAEKVVKYYSFCGDVILDPFMGSGSTGIACLNTNRKFIGIELDETYFQIAKERIENEYI